MPRVLVTGGTGFIGAALTHQIKAGNRFEVSVSVRSDMKVAGAFPHYVADLTNKTSWSSALEGVDVVVHTAARVHVMQDSSADPLAEFRKINVEGTLNLARQAVAAGVKRFVFLSSIKVNGESTATGRAFHADDVPNPKDFYGISKMEAEKALLELAKFEKMEVVVIRPVLVYGPGVKGNFLSMIRWLSRGVPLPFGAIHNQRSLVFLDNLISLIITCIDHPAAANQVFLVSDGEDLSTTQLLEGLLRALDKPSRLIPVPSLLIELIARIAGKKRLSDRLCGSLQVDISKTRGLLGWSPEVSVDRALAKTVDVFLRQGE